MKAIVVEKPGVYRLKEVPTPEITAPDEVLVEIMAVGICGSDISLLGGGNPAATYPRIPGHEMTGRIKKIGSQVTKVKVGDRVIVEPIRYCGKCHACRRGRFNVCQHLQVVSVHVDGGFCEYFVCPETEVHLLPDFISYELATAIEPCTIGEQACSRGDVRQGDTVLIHGAGPIGLVVLDTAKRLGARVIVSEPSKIRRDSAVEFGADRVIDPGREDVSAIVREMTDGVGPNTIIDAAGVPDLLEPSLELLATAGTVVPMSFNPQLTSISGQPINMKELTICGTRHQRMKFPVVIAGLENRMDMLSRYVTHIFDLDQYEEAFTLFRDKDAGARKIVLSVKKA